MTADSKRYSAELAVMIDELRTAPNQTARRRVEDKVLRYMLPHFQQWARTLGRHSGDVYGSHRDDVISVIAERTLEVLREAVLPGKHDKVEAWYSYLNGISRYAALAYFNSSEVTAASGMVALQRKQRHIARVREDLRKKLGREPERTEIVDAANEQMRARRSNPEKQGVLVELTDLDGVLPVADIADHDRAVEEDDYVISPIEGRELVELAIETCFEHSSELGKTAEVWLGDLYSEPPAMGTVTEIARTLHIRQDKASDLLGTARTITRTVLQERFNIALPI
ncbi:hypothetical protein [Curtobacterium sp. MCBD17_040]|uniref:hypothetical protein n=1 Tax=Curtobacterium sp. MCBD17_040 TaxID=2175674 RepID=UPI000DA7E0DA|nr:hypothetical protein [Curtobacterium sp. MCBD17_040]WIB65454.1 hypothetical protein DEI94_18960 [Curtobacterium sp. MCBD17_040]